MRIKKSAIYTIAGPDRDNLKHIPNLSDANVEYITNSPPGQGLIYTGKNVIPFGGEIPKNTKLYRLLTSNPKEKHEYEMERQREKTRLKKEEGQKKIAHFSLAVDKMRKKSGVEEANSEESTAYFFRCTAFDRQAGFMETYGKKGVKFAVEGHLATDYLINN